MTTQEKAVMEQIADFGKKLMTNEQKMEAIVLPKIRAWIQDNRYDLKGDTDWLQKQVDDLFKWSTLKDFVNNEYELWKDENFKAFKGMSVSEIAEKVLTEYLDACFEAEQYEKDHYNQHGY
tara:strand:+ start:375 stop:737 length:363 start_codon:yes stop_codon:yes gene_type:complete